MNLHLIIYSSLAQFGGGRETWLSYFLPNVIDHFDRVLVYALKSDNTKTNLIEAYKLNVDCYYTETIDSNAFVNRTKEYLRNNIQENDICLMIGSIVEGSLAPWLRQYYRNSIKRIIWVRSIAAQEICSRHGHFLYPLVSKIEKRNLSNSDVVITNGYDTFDYYSSYWNKHDKRLCCIPNAVNNELFISKREWSNVEVVKCLFLGRLVPEKGSIEVQKLIDCVNERHPDIKDKYVVEVWGPGNINRESLASNFVICGTADRKDVPDILRATHIEFFVTPPNDKVSGGLSHSLLEGLSSGCLCICSDIPAYRQVINENNGFLFDSDNRNDFVEVFYKTIDDITNNRVLDIIRKSENAVKTSEQFTVRKHMEKFFSLLEQI